MYTQSETRVERTRMKTRDAINLPDEAAFVAMYRQYAPRVYRYIFAWVGDTAAAEDLTSEVFLEALKSFKQSRKKDNLSAWLFTVARNKRVDHYRKHRRLVPIDSLPDLISTAPDLTASSIEAEHLAALREQIKLLKPDQQELLELRFAGELTYAEMARILGKREGAVKMSVHRLLNSLKEALEV